MNNNDSVEDNSRVANHGILLPSEMITSRYHGTYVGGRYMGQGSFQIFWKKIG